MRRTRSTRATPINAARQPDCSEDSLTDDGVVIQILMENGTPWPPRRDWHRKGRRAALAAIAVDVPDHELVCRTVLPRHLVTGGGLFRPSGIQAPNWPATTSEPAYLRDGPLPALSCRKNSLATWSRCVAPDVSIGVVEAGRAVGVETLLQRRLPATCHASAEPETASDWLFQTTVLL